VKAIPVPASPLSPRRSTPSRPGVDERIDLSALIPIGAEAKARIRILVVDDENTLRESCASVLRFEGYGVVVCGRGDEALDALSRRSFDIVLADLYMSQVDGRTLMRAALAANPATLVIIMTGNPSVESSIETLRQGAWDYLPKPFSAAHLQVLVGRAAHTVLVGEEAKEDQSIRGKFAPADDRLALLGTTPSFRRAIDLAKKVASTDASVFITGESGSGKELVALFIHEHSRRSSRPFMPVNCAALPENLVESELFGHRKGAFTGAVRDKPGLLETANGGTLFLDELMELPKPAQAKLLRVIQDGVVRRVGSEETDAVVNLRYIAATNGDSEEAVRNGSLREDLYYRLRVVPIHLPPLRQRPEDIPLLAQYFLTKFWRSRREEGAAPPEFTDSALRELSGHPWQGNVRELQNVIEHLAVVAEPGAHLRAEDLPLTVQPRPVVALNGAAHISASLEELYHPARERVIGQFETQYLTRLISRAGGNLSEAARLADIDRTTLYRLMERHGLHRRPNVGWTLDRERAERPARTSPEDQRS
jgi:DNA-binding NtrC family response regulator